MDLRKYSNKLFVLLNFFLRKMLLRYDTLCLKELHSLAALILLTTASPKKIRLIGDSYLIGDMRLDGVASGMTMLHGPRREIGDGHALEAARYGALNSLAAILVTQPALVLEHGTNPFERAGERGGPGHRVCAPAASRPKRPSFLHEK